jgi:hemerythrin-like metal-binding protein
MTGNDTLLEQIFEHQHSCHALLDSDFRFIRVNEAYAKAIGKPVDFFPGKSYFGLRFPDAEDVFREVLESGKPSRLAAFPVVGNGHSRFDVSYWDCEVDPVQFQDDNKKALLLTEFNVTEQVRSERSFVKNKKLLDAISNAHAHYSQDIDPRVFLDVLISDVIDLTDSEYGILGEVCHHADGQAYMRLLSVPKLAWSEQNQSFIESGTPPNQEFNNMNTLFGEAIKTGEVVIANDPANDPRSGGLPEGHPPVNTFLCIPLWADDKPSFIIGIANRPRGYNQPLVEFLQPLLTAYHHLFNTYVIDTEKREALTSLSQSNLKIRNLLLPLIDYEHEELVNLINECYEEIESDPDFDMIEELLNRIYDGIERHFNNEEELMKNSTYPDRKAHLASHENLLISLRGMIERIVESPEEGIQELKTTLAEWFGRHVSTHDQTLARHFSNSSAEVRGSAHTGGV